MEVASWQKKKQASDKNAQSGVQKRSRGQSYAEWGIIRYWLFYAELLEVGIKKRKAQMVLGPIQT